MRPVLEVASYRQTEFVKSKIFKLTNLRAQTSASDSALVSVVAARSKYQREHPHIKMEDLVIYTTSQTHSLGAKAGVVLGLQVRSLDVKSEDDFSLRGNTLREALEEDAKIGRKAFILSTQFHCPLPGALGS